MALLMDNRTGELRSDPNADVIPGLSYRELLEAETMPPGPYRDLIGRELRKRLSLALRCLDKCLLSGNLKAATLVLSAESRGILAEQGPAAPPGQPVINIVCVSPEVAARLQQGPAPIPAPMVEVRTDVQGQTNT